MCSRHPEPGAGHPDSFIDSLSADGAQEWNPRPFLVTLDGDDGERIVTRVNAIGPQNAKGLARDKYPGFTPVKVGEEATDFDARAFLAFLDQMAHLSAEEQLAAVRIYLAVLTELAA